MEKYKFVFEKGMPFIYDKDSPIVDLIIDLLKGKKFEDMTPAEQKILKDYGYSGMIQ